MKRVDFPKVPSITSPSARPSVKTSARRILKVFGGHLKAEMAELGGFLERDSQELIGLVHGKSIYKWMITRGTPISGNLHIYDINGN